MRKLDDTTRSLPAVKLFRSDLERLMLAFGKGTRFELRHGGYVYQSIDELATRVGQAPIGTLSISGTGEGTPQPSVRVSIHPTQVEFAAHPPTGDAPAAVLKVLEEQSRGMQPPWWRTTFGVLAWTVSLVVGVGLLLQASVPFAPRAFLAVALSLLLYSLLSALPRTLGESTVYLYERQERMEFLRRNGAMLAVSALTGLIGVIIGKLL